MLERVTLDQLRMLVTIADAGSFTAAAKELDRAQSAVSHAIAGLELDIGVALFDRATRKPKITSAGRAVLAEARTILGRVDHLKARARAISAGLEAELLLAVSVVAPREALINLLDAFRTEFPSVGLRLFVEEVGGAPQLVMEGIADLGLVGRPSLATGDYDGLEAVAVGTVEIVAVAHPSHPLALLGRPLSEADMDDHRQLVPTSRALPRYPNRLVQDVWEIADLVVRRDMLLRGLGWGTVPRHIAEDALQHGGLVELDISARPQEAMRVPLYACHRKATAPGPAAQWLIDEMSRTFS
ncbi:MAG: LysR family transcriptional regulator [Pseudomonadota bacterium]